MAEVINIKELNERIERESVFVDTLRREMGKVIVGQQHLVDTLLIGLLSNGHILLEGVPGLAKTLAITTLAKAVDANFSRIQFTPDLLPADLLGTLIYSQKSEDFIVKKGPVFANFVLADEINRSPAKVQSALLEAMQERQVTIGDETYPLPQPFLVLATQNPLEQEGTYPLPEAQVDRFLMRLSLGYPSANEEKAILDRHIEQTPLAALTPVCTAADIVEAQNAVRKVHLSDAVKDYIVRISSATRSSDRLRIGVSPRGTLALAHVAQAYAALQGRDYVLPDDVKAVAVPVLAHRVISKSQSSVRLAQSTETVIDYLLSTIPAPIES